MGATLSLSINRWEGEPSTSAICSCPRARVHSWESSASRGCDLRLNWILGGWFHRLRVSRDN